jgi:hypothetical protein
MTNPAVVIEHFPQRMRLTRCLKVLEAQFTAVDARALDDTMYEPDSGTAAWKIASLEDSG